MSVRVLNVCGMKRFTGAASPVQTIAEDDDIMTSLKVLQSNEWNSWGEHDEEMTSIDMRNVTVSEKKTCFMSRSVIYSYFIVKYLIKVKMSSLAQCCLLRVSIRDAYQSVPEPVLRLFLTQCESGGCDTICSYEDYNFLAGGERGLLLFDTITACPL